MTLIDELKRRTTTDRAALLAEYRTLLRDDDPDTAERLAELIVPLGLTFEDVQADRTAMRRVEKIDEILDNLDRHNRPTRALADAKARRAKAMREAIADLVALCDDDLELFGVYRAVTSMIRGNIGKGVVHGVSPWVEAEKFHAEIVTATLDIENAANEDRRLKRERANLAESNDRVVS